MPSLVRTASFAYSDAQFRSIREALEQAGIEAEIYWPRLQYVITVIAHAVSRKAQTDKQTYAGATAKQLRKVADVLRAAATIHESLDSSTHGLIESWLDAVHEEFPLLQHSLPPDERRTLKKLASGKRLQLLLEIVACAAERAALPLESAGKIVPLSSPLPSTLPAPVKAAVKQAVRAKRRPYGGRFPTTGAPRERVVQWALPRLWSIFKEVTGREPKVYPSAHNGSVDGYGGGFYLFVKSVLLPLHVIPLGSLPNAIFTSYKAHREMLLPEPPVRMRTKK